MRVLLDHNAPPRLSRWWRDRGHAAGDVRDVGLSSASDAVVWRWAAENADVILTKDADVERMVGTRGPPPRLLWLRVGTQTTAALLAVLDDHEDVVLRWLSDPNEALHIMEATD